MTKDTDHVCRVPWPPDDDIWPLGSGAWEFVWQADVNDGAEAELAWRHLEWWGSEADVRYWNDAVTAISHAAFYMEAARQLIEDGHPDKAAALLQHTLTGMDVHPDYFAEDHARRRSSYYLKYAEEIESAKAAQEAGQ